MTWKSTTAKPATKLAGRPPLSGAMKHWNQMRANSRRWRAKRKHQNAHVGRLHQRVCGCVATKCWWTQQLTSTRIPQTVSQEATIDRQWAMRNEHNNLPASLPTSRPVSLPLRLRKDNGSSRHRLPATFGEWINNAEWLERASYPLSCWLDFAVLPGNILYAILTACYSYFYYMLLLP